MCGFFITNDPDVRSEHEYIIENTLRFRGPDCSSGLITYDSGWKAYHSRLSIIDINSGTNQPYKNKNGDVLVFNGEILNYKHLGWKYFNKEYNSDTVLLNDLILTDNLKWHELDGFFAFVYINKSGQIKHAARDRFGVKPLFYYKRNGYISFSSEPKTLREIFNLDVNDLAVEEYRAARFPLFEGSFFNGVNQIGPGECYIQGVYFDVLDYISLDYSDVSLDDIELALKSGIESRLISDVPVGLLLSKGIDSHLIKNIGKFNKYYSIGFEGDDDLEYLKKKKYENLTLITLDYDSYKADFEYLLALRGEPMSVPNEVLLYHIAKKAASDGVKVLLSGEGADEFFAGYDRIFSWAYSQVEFDLDTFLKMYCYIKPEANSLVEKKFKEVFSCVPQLNCFEKVRWFFVKYHLPILFRRLDFSLMAAGVEGREPLANMHTFLVSNMISPKSLFLKSLGKKPLRNIMSKYMGEEFSFSNKVGFPVDLRKVFSDEKLDDSYEIWFKKNLEILRK